jgi:signal transduction histidine kinase
MELIGRLGLVVATALVGALAVAVLVAGARAPAQVLGGSDLAARWLHAGAGAVVWSAGLLLVRQHAPRTSGWLVAAAGAALLAGSLPLPRAGGDVLFTVGIAAALAAPGLAGAAALTYVAPRRPDAYVAIAAAGAGVLAAGVVPALLFDPVAEGCFECPRNLILVHGDVGAHDAVVRAGLVAAASTCVAAAALAAVRLVGRPPLLRRVVAVVVAPLTLACALGAALLIHDSVAGLPARDETSRVLWLLLCCTLLAAAGGVFAEALRARVLRNRIAGGVVAMLPTPDQLRAALAAELGDPGLEIAFPTADGGTVDAGGDPVSAAPAGTSVTQVRRPGGPIAELRLDAALAPPRSRVVAAARGAALALEHAALRAQLHAELRELDASRARVVAAADSERRRLERDLHDGAQQRLIALSFALPDHRLRPDLLAALQELRDIAHGIHPVSLSDAGLEAAVRELADGSRVPVRVGALPSGRLPAPVEFATHRLVVDAVACAAQCGDGSGVQVEISQQDGSLCATVRAPGVDPARAAADLEHSADRLAALGGRLEISPGAVIAGMLPCGS